MMKCENLIESYIHPNFALLSETLYIQTSTHHIHYRFMFMLQCWEFESKNRPTFSNLVNSLSQSLEAMAGYIHVGAFQIGGVMPNPSEIIITASTPEASDEPADHDPTDHQISD